MKFTECLVFCILASCASGAPTPTSTVSSVSKSLVSSTSKASAVHPTIIISTASHPTTNTRPTITASIPTTLKQVVASHSAAVPAATVSSNPKSPFSSSSSGNTDIAPLVQAAQLFNIQTFREGVPYLHKRQVQLTPSNELVINAEQGTGSGVIPFVGYLSDMRTLVATRDDSNTKASVAVYPDGSLKLWLNSLITVPDNTEEPVGNNNSTGIILADGTEVGPWTITAEKFLTLNSNSNAWSCPEGKSGVYHIYWSEDRPTGKFGCLKVDLYVPDGVTGVLQKRFFVPEDILKEPSLKRQFWEFVRRH
ncbi:uncharacterized protein SAPINGB_P005408 [Magnusiomyces paraingens]|uniref:Uncharacterized protein n=1 Tax=Magnusiomyces paraingens TaxID=2606893 RepID=A0A5E8C4N5_9ASCO|nr:uncharacterized protein SAPINGB_P005408 [Saprochaete ingens]VVT56921.1 unnamed protein product [Saprochaete ingens]